MLEESAFWTYELQGVSFRWALTVGTVCALFFFVAAGVFLLRASHEAIAEWGRVFFAVLAVILSGDVLLAAFRFKQTADVAKRVYTGLGAARAAGYPEAELLFLLCEYDAAVTATTMTWPGVYARHQDRLNLLWARHLAEQSGRAE
jgi:hypothetical protein